MQGKPWFLRGPDSGTGPFSIGFLQPVHLRLILNLSPVALEANPCQRPAMESTYTAIIQQDNGWWIGWIEEVPGVNAQEATKEELLFNWTGADRSVLTDHSHAANSPSFESHSPHPTRRGTHLGRRLECRPSAVDRLARKRCLSHAGKSFSRSRSGKFPGSLSVRRPV